MSDESLHGWLGLGWFRSAVGFSLNGAFVELLHIEELQLHRRFSEARLSPSWTSEASTSVDMNARFVIARADRF